MTSRIEKARHFHELHVPHHPIVLYNIWDAGSAAAVARAGAKAIATSSWSLAAAQGYADGEALPLEDALAIIERIAASVELPVTVDFEGGYASDPEGVGQNVRRVLTLGVVGLNFEDQVMDGSGLYSIPDQVARLRAVRAAANALGVPAFINARTDVFLKAAPDVDHAALVADALARNEAYANAGADGFFVPGLTDKELIAAVCKASTLPVNVMMSGDTQDFRDVAALGVARISLGPSPYVNLISIMERAAALYI